MFEKTKEIVNKYFDNNYAIVPNQDGTSSVVFFVPYRPYEREGEGKVFIDAYYKASNELYHKTNEFIKELNTNGIKADRLQCDLKSLATKGGLGQPTHTTLVANEKYGTKIVLGAISVPYDWKMIRRSSNLCTYCYECVRACPTGALSRNGFERSICIRQLQLDDYVSSDKLAQLMGNKVQGCDLCQRACMLNAFIESEPIPKELKKYLDVDYLLLSAYKGKEAIAGLETFIGRNYLRPKKLLALSLNAANNIRSHNNLDLASNLLDSDYKAISINAKRMLDSYNKRH